MPSLFVIFCPGADIAYQNKAVIYDILFKASAETMITPLLERQPLFAAVMRLRLKWGVRA